jgi:hydroxymethylglutaryl-CoA reductase
VAETLPSYCNEDIKHIKIENCIGFTQVPLSLASPLTIHGESKRTVYAPLVIVEPTLIISCSREYKVFKAIGGIKVEVLSKGLSHALIFTFRTVNDALQFYYYIPIL